MNHPKDRSERRRSVEAKTLGTSLYRQRKINAKRRSLLVTIKDSETQNELQELVESGLPE